MTKQQIRESLAEAIIKGQARSAHPDHKITKAEALVIVSKLEASDQAPEWNMIIFGRSTFHQVVAEHLRK